MKKLFVILFVLLTSSSVVLAKTYKIDPVHSQVSFSIPHLGIFKVRGNFKQFSGKIKANPKQKRIQSVTGIVKVASIDTREAKRDGHLKSADFFNVSQFKNIKFVSTKITGKGRYTTIYGKLTIRGITKTVKLKSKFLGVNKDPWGNYRAGVEATGTIDRRAFGLKWSKVLETGSLLVGNKVTIKLEIQAIQQK
jgi:polyisoprenoid-binding protein YceI